MNRHLLCSMAAALLVAGCGGAPRSAGSKAPAAASADWRNGQVAQAVARLNKGDRAGARRIVQGVLKRVPGDAAAQRLLDQIDGKVTVPERPPERDHRATPPRRPAPEPAPHRQAEPPRVAPEPTPPPAASPTPPPAVRDPARAARLRGAGLEQMNRGAIARAVALLEEASRLDPGNPLIGRDLERARRIQRTVRGSR